MFLLQEFYKKSFLVVGVSMRLFAVILILFFFCNLCDAADDMDFREFHFLPSMVYSHVTPPNRLGESTSIPYSVMQCKKMGLDSCVIHDFPLAEQNEINPQNIFLVCSISLWETPYQNPLPEYSYLYVHTPTDYEISECFKEHGVSTPFYGRFKRAFNVGRVSNIGDIEGFFSYPSIDVKFSLPGQSFRNIDFATARLFFCGANWDQRQVAVIRGIDKTGFLDLFGPQSAWGNGYKSYRGFCDSVISAAQESGVSLVFHSKKHLERDEPSARIFEAAASSSLIISDKLPFVMKNFGDSIFYIDHQNAPEMIFNQIMDYFQWIRKNPVDAAKMARRSYQIFSEKFVLEDQIFNIAETHQDTLRLDNVRTLSPSREFKYSLRALDSKRSNTIIKVNVFKTLRIKNNTSNAGVVTLIIKDIGILPKNSSKNLIAPEGFLYIATNCMNDVGFPVIDGSSPFIMLENLKSTEEVFKIYLSRNIEVKSHEELDLLFPGDSSLYSVNFEDLLNYELSYTAGLFRLTLTGGT
ncbi:MAG: hypothetical protein NTX76_02080 [Alphaproteobacteria bacterium]|nr:hypothetical protein [Alphaproteobacteria bacterium]